MNATVRVRTLVLVILALLWAGLVVIVSVLDDWSFLSYLAGLTAGVFLSVEWSK